MSNTIENYSDYILVVLELDARDISKVTLYTRSDMYNSRDGKLETTVRAFNDDTYVEIQFQNTLRTICLWGFCNVDGDGSGKQDDAKELCKKVSLDDWNNSKVREYIDENF